MPEFGDPHNYSELHSWALLLQFPTPFQSPIHSFQTNPPFSSTQLHSPKLAAASSQPSVPVQTPKRQSIFSKHPPLSIQITLFLANGSQIPMALLEDINGFLIQSFEIKSLNLRPDYFHLEHRREIELEFTLRIALGGKSQLTQRKWRD
jgi:hypothetical protein